MKEQNSASLRSPGAAARYGYLISGIVLLACAGFLFSRSGLGMDPISVLYDGFSVSAHIRLGTATMLTSIISLFFLFFIDRGSIGVGTVAVTFGIGPIINLLLGAIRWTPSSFPQQLLLSVLGAFTVGVAEGLYLHPKLGSGPLDAIMMFTAKKTGIRLGLFKIIFDVTCVAAGFLLGGKVGVGTCIAALLTGPVMNATLRRTAGREKQAA